MHADFILAEICLIQSVDFYFTNHSKPLKKTFSGRLVQAERNENLFSYFRGAAETRRSQGWYDYSGLSVLLYLHRVCKRWTDACLILMSRRKVTDMSFFAHVCLAVKSTTSTGPQLGPKYEPNFLHEVLSRYSCFYDFSFICLAFSAKHYTFALEKVGTCGRNLKSHGYKTR